MKLITGLGNPGSRYRDTRHNVGFRVIAELSRRFGQPRPSSKFESEYVQVNVGQDRVVLQSPLTYMNLSGRAVRGLMDFYKIPAEDILVICDDIQLPLGRLRFRPNGSAGGQNGLKDIIGQLGTREFARLRLGIGSPPAEWDVADYVLSKFASTDEPIIEQAIVKAADGVLVWVEKGIQECMNRFNGDPDKPKKQPKKPIVDADSQNDAVAEKADGRIKESGADNKSQSGRDTTPDTPPK